MSGPSLAEAKKALAATEEAAIEMGVGLSCAVVDSRGALVALARMDGARYFTADVAVGKARASAAFGAPSGELTRLASMGLDEAIHGGPMCSSSREPCRSWRAVSRRAPLGAAARRPSRMKMRPALVSQ